MLRVTRSRLSDGREILYFDTPDTPPRMATDERALPVVRTESTMRRDPLTGQWSLFAAHRQNRTFLPPANEDPLAPTRPGGYPSEIPEADYQVAVFENRFPSLTLHGVGGTVGGALDDAQRPALGRCEVVCFTPEPEGSFADLPLERKRALIEVWAHRTEELSRIEGIRAVFPFENRGEEIGVTLPHPHGQIYSYPFVPPRMASIAEQVRLRPNLFDEVIEAELRAEERIIHTTPSFVVYTPLAAKWPVEVMVMPRRAVPDFPALNTEEREELAGILHSLFPAVDRFFEGVERTPYIAAWNQAPVGQPEAGRLHLQLFSLMRSPHRMKYLAGSESGMGAWINDTTPETIAETFRRIWQ
ncbi:MULTISPECIES: galactose-1-phosphate uridylyltransferase [unclassified Corynebacterium]|uniref:galactose-1-phosphate uridylyltransferase n=1 Tax=unclassified Corynebacterium TaxID=2624378 RepID=UPI0029CA2DDC|nr:MULTISPECIES: galactose-1-phosphate uridylyltransferase [unclassified Corynebacterium]WPF67120.1 galactose-1-phosphate uridylyltransferase [Corynebacterium sp. 22KM0430]WPF69608.1 galactose-1-phosphate uridylyltransferase [Corynebacterium sp. 21KM1197]